MLNSINYAEYLIALNENSVTNEIRTNLLLDTEINYENLFYSMLKILLSNNTETLMSTLENEFLSLNLVDKIGSFYDFWSPLLYAALYPIDNNDEVFYILNELGDKAPDQYKYAIYNSITSFMVNTNTIADYLDLAKEVLEKIKPLEIKKANETITFLTNIILYKEV